MIFPPASVNLRKLFVFLHRERPRSHEEGIGEIPIQMAEQLPAEQLKLGHSVSEVHAHEIKTKDGKSWQGRAVVLATDFGSADRLLKIDSKPREWNAVDCFYYSFPETELPTSRPILHLNGSGEGPINNLSFVSSLPTVPQWEMGLLSASVIGKKNIKVEELEIEAKQQLIEWFGERPKNGKIFKCTVLSKPCLFVNVQPKKRLNKRDLPVRRLSWVTFDRCGHAERP